LTPLVALAACLLTPGGTALAEEAVSITLAQALERAARDNPELAATRERAEAQAARGDAVARLRWPRASLSASWHRSDNPSWVFADKLTAGEFAQDDFAISRLNDPGSTSHLTTTAGIELPLDVFGKVADQAKAQRASGRAAGATLEEARLELRLRVVDAYRRAALARRAVEATERALEGAKGREAAAEARVSEGAALTADLLRARARRRQREADLADRRGDAAVTAAGLARLLGAEPGTSYVATDSPAAPGPLDGDETTWITRAAAGRPTLAAAHERLEVARRAARLEGRGLLPELAAWGQLQDDRNSFSGGGQSYAVGAQLRWSAFDASRGKREAAAAAELHAAELDARAAADQVRLEAAVAFRHAQATRERYAAATGGAEEGREALRVVQERRRAGIATLTDELETEAASLGAELEEIRAAAEAAIADAALERAAGTGTAAAETRRHGEREQ
jgi:outer membrane protein TolC